MARTRDFLGGSGGNGGGGRDGGGGGRDGGGGGRRGSRRKVDRFLADKTLTVDYKDPSVLKHFITERGKIVPRRTLIEKILTRHASAQANAGDIIEIAIDARIARDFGGASVVGHLEANGLELEDPSKTFFTFDCNPTGSDQKYAAHQQRCRGFARARGIKVFDLGSGIGTHLAVDSGLVWPGSTLVSTDSHANIVGALGAFGQGMGDLDIAAAFAHGKIWFSVPPTVRLYLDGRPGPHATAKDIALKILATTGASGLLGAAVEVEGEIVRHLSVDARLTIASMGTEMGAIALLFSPNEAVLTHCRQINGREPIAVYPDSDANYIDEIHINIEGLQPLIARPGHPEDVIPVAEVRGTPIDSAFIGSCTNGRVEDLQAAARVLADRKPNPEVVLKVVPSTDAIWRWVLKSGLIDEFKRVGALFTSAGCAGCAAGQVGQNGTGEVTISSGNRNFPGKQGKGDVWLASPATVAASAIVGALASAADDLVPRPRRPRTAPPPIPDPGKDPLVPTERPTILEGRVFVVPLDNIDTDMIFHNRHLAVTDPHEMAPFAFGNLPGYEHFPDWVAAGDLIWTGGNFGCGSSRQQAVDVFLALGVRGLIAPSYGSIYLRNAINAGLPAVRCATPPGEVGIKTGDRIRLDLRRGTVERSDAGPTIPVEPLAEVPLQIYQRGGLLHAS